MQILSGNDGDQSSAKLIHCILRALFLERASVERCALLKARPGRAIVKKCRRNIVHGGADVEYGTVE